MFQVVRSYYYPFLAAYNRCRLSPHLKHGMEIEKQKNEALNSFSWPKDFRICISYTFPINVQLSVFPHNICIIINQ